MEENRCICCGEIIPEGLQVCPSCMATARLDCQHVWVFNGFTDGELVRCLDYRCNACGAHRYAEVEQTNEGKKGRRLF